MLIQLNAANKNAPNNGMPVSIMLTASKSFWPVKTNVEPNNHAGFLALLVNLIFQLLTWATVLMLLDVFLQLLITC